jgi:nitrogen-specific signal transduction histidine kinase
VIRQTNIGERALKIIKSKTESLEKDKSKETIHHIYNSEKEIKSTTTVDICNNQEDYDPTLVLIADNIDHCVQSNTATFLSILSFPQPVQHSYILV